MQSRLLRITLRTLLILVALGVIGLGIFAYQAFQDIGYTVYLPCGAADLVIEHMKANNGAWPRNWEELHRTFLLVEERNGIFRGFRWNDYPRRVGIDFRVDPAKLATAKVRPGERPFHVIWSLAIPDAKSPVDPNRILFEYLTTQNPGTTPASDRPAGSPRAD